jgi:hypothetical protein
MIPVTGAIIILVALYTPTRGLSGAFAVHAMNKNERFLARHEVFDAVCTCFGTFLKPFEGVS